VQCGQRYSLPIIPRADGLLGDALINRLPDPLVGVEVELIQLIQSQKIQRDLATEGSQMLPWTFPAE
jgi:hypothetical protein